MAQVSLRINGYGYILGCADGEEDHLLTLAADLDRRIEEIKTSGGSSGEARLLLMAALVLSDELHDMRKQAEQRDGGGKSEPRVNRRLKGLTRRAESIAAAEVPPLVEALAAASAGGFQHESQTEPYADVAPTDQSAPDAEHVAATDEHP